MTEAEAAACAYARYVVAGGSATWPDWWALEGDAAAGSPPPATAAATPTDLQLEVVRRLALLDVPDLSGLGELVLATPAAGRGRMERTLPWPPRQASRLPATDLLRVCCPVLVALLGRLELPAVPDRRPASLWSRWRNRREPVVLAAGPFETMMVRAWRHRVSSGATLGWQRFWRRAEVRDSIPRGADPARSAAEAALRSGGRPVRVVLEERPSDHGGVDLPGVDLLGVDLWRRVNLVLRHTTLPYQPVAAVLPGLLAPDEGGATQVALAAPSANRAWARAAADRVADALGRASSAGDYAVHGDVAVVRQRVDGPDRLRAEHTLQRALLACSRAWQEVRR